jgi:hypothetical protein
MYGMATLRFGQKMLSTIQTVVMCVSFAFLLLNQSMTSFIVASVLRGIASGCGVGIDTLSTRVVTPKHVERMVGEPAFFDDSLYVAGVSINLFIFAESVLRLRQRTFDTSLGINR